MTLQYITFTADTSNYITKQHNILGEWLHENLCQIYKVSGSSCDPAVGPLEEDQTYIPMQLHWPEGQLNIMEKIDELQTTLPFSIEGKLQLDYTENSNVSSAGNLGTITHKIGALSDAVENKLGDKVNVIESKVDSLSNDMKDKVNAVQSKVDALADDVKGKVDTVQNELMEIKAMLTKLMRTMADQ